VPILLRPPMTRIKALTLRVLPVSRPNLEVPGRVINGQSLIGLIRLRN
jgi:hypothetical protein